MTFVEIINTASLATGLLYLLLEIIQSKWMWVVGIFTGGFVAVSFALQHTWASMGLNIYYVIMSFVGIVLWTKASKQTSKGAYHLVHLPRKVLIYSIITAAIGIPALMALLHFTHGSETALDSVAVVLSAIGTWWLAKSYLEQWLVWIIADTISTVLCIALGNWWTAALYIAYTLWAVFGYYLWKRKGEYIG